MSEFYDIILNKKSNDDTNKKTDKKKKSNDINNLFRVKKKKLKLIHNKAAKILDPKYENQATTHNNEVIEENKDNKEFREKIAYDRGRYDRARDLIDPSIDNKIKELEDKIKAKKNQISYQDMNDIQLRANNNVITRWKNAIIALNKQRDNYIHEQNNNEQFNIDLKKKRTKSSQKK